MKFTVVEMQNNQLIYLDTKLVDTDGKLELEQYRKTDNHTTSMMNYNIVTI